MYINVNSIQSVSIIQSCFYLSWYSFYICVFNLTVCLTFYLSEYFLKIKNVDLTQKK